MPRFYGAGSMGTVRQLLFALNVGVTAFGPLALAGYDATPAAAPPTWCAGVIEIPPNAPVGQQRHTACMRFRATIELFGKTATGLRVPADVVAGLGERKRPPVRVTIGAHTYRSTVAAYGDEFFLPLNAKNRASAGSAAGEEVDVDLELDTEPRTVTVPGDLTAALAADADAHRHFDALSFSHQREYVEWIDEAKRADTRARRIAKAVRMLNEGRTQR